MNTTEQKIERARAGWMWVSSRGLIHIGTNTWGKAYCGVAFGGQDSYAADVNGTRNRNGGQPCRRCAAVLFRARAAEDRMLLEHGFIKLQWNTEGVPACAHASH